MKKPYSTGIEYHEGGTIFSMEIGDKQRKTEDNIEFGDACISKNQFQSAIKYFEKALGIAKQRKDDRKEKVAYLRLGRAYILNNQFQTAIEYYEKVLEIVLEPEDRRKETDAYLGLGDAYMYTNQIQMAIERYERASEMAKELEDKRQEVHSYIGLGLAYKLNEQFQTAIEYILKFLKSAKAREHKGQETKTYFGLRDAHKVIRNVNEFQTSIKYDGKARKTAKERQDKRQEILPYIELGDVYILNKDFQTAIDYYERALEIAKEEEDKHQETEGDFGFGVAYRVDDQFQTEIECCENALERAIEHHLKTLEIAKERKDKRQETDGYLSLGDTYNLKGNTQKVVQGSELEETRVGLALSEIDDSSSLSTITGYPKADERILPMQETSSVQDRETKPRREEICQDKKNTWFKNNFLNSKLKLKKEIHEGLRSFPWLCGAYGLSGPNKKIRRPHIYLTVKRGSKKSDVRRDLEDKFLKCDAKEYFELLQEPKREPKIKFLGRDRNRLTVESKASSVQPSSGGGVLACINHDTDTDRNPMRLPEENERDYLPEVLGAGTLTMFCFRNGLHYALTCFHIGCVFDEDRLNGVINKAEDIQKIRSSLKDRKSQAKRKQYYFTEAKVENNNEPISFGDDGSTYTNIGVFDDYHFDEECDIMSLQLLDDVEIDCKISVGTSPDWDSIRKELYERVFETTGHNPVEVEKIGYSSALTQGHIVPYDFSYSKEKEPLFEDAYVVKRFSAPFLEDGDSGSLVFFHDKNNLKQVFAYGVCEVDADLLPEQHKLDDSTSHERTLPEQHDSMSSTSQEHTLPKHLESTGSTLHVHNLSEQHDSTSSTSQERTLPEQHGSTSSTSQEHTLPEHNESTSSTLHEHNLPKQHVSACFTSHHEEHTFPGHNGSSSSTLHEHNLPKQHDLTSPTSQEHSLPKQLELTSSTLQEHTLSDQPTSSTDRDSDTSSTWSEEDHDDESDVEVIFQEESENNISDNKMKKEAEGNSKKKVPLTGSYSICLSLDTALEKLEFLDAACFNDCANSRK